MSSEIDYLKVRCRDSDNCDLSLILGEVPPEKIHYCERFLELLIDLEALLPTRRFFNTVLDDCHVVVRCRLSPLTKRPDGKLFVQVSRKYGNLLCFKLQNISFGCKVTQIILQWLLVLVGVSEEGSKVFLEELI